jgi:hypothetical protein
MFSFFRFSQMKKTVQRWGKKAHEEVTKLTLTKRPLVNKHFCSFLTTLF